MMSLRLAVATIAVAACGTFGCSGREAVDPHAFIAEETARVQARAAAASGPQVAVRCDEEGGLHATAPEGAVVQVPVAAYGDDAEVAIALAGLRDVGGPIRTTRSLGFIGDAPLTQTRSYGGPWNVPDAVLPIHAHGYGGTYGGTYGGGYAPVAFGGAHYSHHHHSSGGHAHGHGRSRSHGRR